jgi:hypothetical protein
MLSKRKEDASYTKSEGGGGTAGYVSAGEKRVNGRRESGRKTTTCDNIDFAVQHKCAAEMFSAGADAGATGKKKPAVAAG